MVNKLTLCIYDFFLFNTPHLKIYQESTASQNACFHTEDS